MVLHVAGDLFRKELSWLDENNDRQCLWLAVFLFDNKVIEPEHIPKCTSPTTGNVASYFIQENNSYAVIKRVIDSKENRSSSNSHSKIEENMAIDVLKNARSTWEVIQHSDQNISWMFEGKSKLRLYWLLGYLTKRYYLITQSISLTKGQIKNIIQLLFDIFIPPHEVPNASKQLFNEWEQIQHTLNLFDWLDKNDNDLCSWSYEYLQKRNYLAFSQRLSEDYEEYYAVKVSLMLLLQPSGRQSPSDLALLIGKLRTSCRQKKYRQNMGDKKPQNFKIGKSTRKKLVEICRLSGLSTHEVVENLIKNEYDALVRGKR